MRKIGLFNIGKLGLVKSAGTGKTDINKVIEKWIPKHMVFWYDVQKQGATNEILKANPYLQDFSGNNRPLKLNNFLFAAMSGVGGYETNFSDNSIWISSPQHGNLINNHTYNPMLKGSVSGLYTATSSVKVKFKATVTGMKSGYRLEFGSGDVAPSDKSIYEDGEYEFGSGDVAPSDKSIYEDGEYEFGSGDVAVPYGFKLYADDYSNPNTDVIIELKEVYPNALVTDGVDDYGVVENLQQGVKVLFVTINPFVDGKFIYDQRLNTTEPWLFAVFNDKGSIAYNSRNSNGKTYIDGTLNESTIVSALLNKKQIITIVNNDVTGDKTKTPIFFSNTDHNSGWISSAFYDSFGFDSVPTKETDGFTEQDLIDYYIPKAIIVTITVVDVSGSPIQDATVTVEGVQYKTLSDGTVKVRGMVNSTMSLSVKKDGYMPFSDNSWKLADSRITLEVLRNTVITENGYSILLENDGLILTE